MAETRTPEEREGELAARVETLAEEVAALRNRVEQEARQRISGPESDRVEDLLEEAGRRMTALWNRGMKEVAQSGRESPLTTAALAFGAGLLLGALTRRK